MSQEIINNLNKELDNSKAQFDAVMSALDAHKGMLNESITASLNIRTALVQFQKKTQELTNELAQEKAKIVSLNDLLTKAQAKIKELETPAPVVAEPEAVAA